MSYTKDEHNRTIVLVKIKQSNRKNGRSKCWILHRHTCYIHTSYYIVVYITLWLPCTSGSYMVNWSPTLQTAVSDLVSSFFILIVTT